MEVNIRVNYPLKNILNDIVRKDQINIANEQVKFSVSWIYEMWRGKACICFKNYGTIIEFQV